MAQPLPAPIRLSPWEQWSFVHRPGSNHTELRQRYGDIVPFAFQGQRFAVVLTPAGVQQVFSAAPAGYDAFWKESFMGLNGPGSLWVLAGEKHRRERQLFAPAVHAAGYRPYGDTIRDIARRHLDTWRPGQAMKAADAMAPIARDVIMRLVFGVADEALIAVGSDTLERHTRSIHPLIVFFPWLQRGWFPLWRRYRRLTAELHRWMDSIISQRRAAGMGSVDVLERLLTARDEEGRPYEDAHIRNELVSILGAGYNTTAIALAWAMYELGRQPALLAKLRAEIESSPALTDTAARLHLPYLSAVVKETIRLHPILAECARVPTAPMEILGYTIPAGNALVISIAGIHHDPDLYPEPNRFRPERFLERDYNGFEFLPFGGAHRRCLGEGLAEYVMRIVLAEIVLGFDFVPTAEDRDVRHDISMGPKRGVPMRITARRTPRPAGAPEPALPEMVNA